MNRSSHAGTSGRTHFQPSYQLTGIVLAGLASAVLLFMLLALTAWHLYFAWLVSVNLVTFAIFGIDKALAKTNQLRIPEFVLHLFTVLGGFLGQFAGRLLFHHKTNFRRHPSFTIVPFVSFLLWAAIGYLLFF